MKRTLQVLNELELGGVIDRYAIGGAMGATFYVEPLLTFDLDVVLPQSAAGLLSLAPLYEALLARGYIEEGECVLIEGVPIQFLPAYNALLEEALREARETLYEEVPTRVVRAEHLIVICLQTGRDKDRERVRIFREQAELDMNYLAGVRAPAPTASKGNGSNGHPETGNRPAFRREGSAPPQAGGAAFPGQCASCGVPPGNGRSGIARARYKSTRVESRRPRRVIHARTRGTQNRPGPYPRLRPRNRLGLRLAGRC